MGAPIADIVPATTQVDAAFWMRAAQGAIRRECGWHVAPIITETLVVDGSGGTELLLPSLRILELVEVLNDGQDVTEHVKFSPDSGIIGLRSGWSCELGGVSVRLLHGYEPAEVPDVAGLIVTLTKRAATGGTVVQQTIGSASQRLATGKDGAVLGVPLLQSEKELLGPYRITWGP